jgi:hypothetical protein
MLLQARMIRQLSAFVTIIAVSGIAAAAEATDCYTTFYQTQNMECVDALLDTVNTSADAWAAQPRSMPGAVVGFLAQIFIDHPEERKQILEKKVTLSVGSIYLSALVNAGLWKEAKAYADAIGWSEGFKRYHNTKGSNLTRVKPTLNPSDNDLLIGAYMASGNTAYISNILENYSSASDGMVSDAFRVALMQSKFGPRLTAPGRPNSMAPAICNKYKCKADIKDMMRVMTLATAFWAIHSLAQHDENVKKTMLEFFDDHQNVKMLLAAEQNAFGNYIMMLSAYAGIKDNPNINSALSIYEELGSAKDALNSYKRMRNG